MICGHELEFTLKVKMKDGCFSGGNTRRIHFVAFASWLVLFGFSVGNKHTPFQNKRLKAAVLGLVIQE